jgi:hypothetical protein
VNQNSQLHSLHLLQSNTISAPPPTIHPGKKELNKCIKTAGTLLCVIGKNPAKGVHGFTKNIGSRGAIEIAKEI